MAIMLCPECKSDRIQRYTNNGVDCLNCGHMGRAEDFGAKCSCAQEHLRPWWYCAVHGEVTVNVD